MVWDFGGLPHIRDLWPFYSKQVLANVIVFVVNANECIMRLREAKRVLHWVLENPFLQRAELMIVVNKRPKPSKGAPETLVFVEYSLKKSQFIDLLKLKPESNGEEFRDRKIKRLKQFFSGEVVDNIYEFDVNDNNQSNIFFEEVAKRIKNKEEKLS